MTWNVLLFIGLARPGSALLRSGLSRVWGLAPAPGLGGSRLLWLCGLAGSVVSRAGAGAAAAAQRLTEETSAPPLLGKVWTPDHRLRFVQINAAHRYKLRKQQLTNTKQKVVRKNAAKVRKLTNGETRQHRNIKLFQGTIKDDAHGRSVFAV